MPYYAMQAPGYSYRGRAGRRTARNVAATVCQISPQDDENVIILEACDDGGARQFPWPGLSASRLGPACRL